MKTEANRLVESKLSPLADYLLAELGGSNFKMLKQKMREAIQNGHAVLTKGSLDVSTIADHVFSDAFVAASQRRIERVRKEHVQRMEQESAVSQAHVETQKSASSVSADSVISRNETRLEELVQTPCSRCGQTQLVLWTNDREHFCENCLKSRNSNSVRMLFYPHALADGTWISKPTASFSVLREYIEKCMRPTTAGKLGALLVSSPLAVEALINFLESKIILPADNSTFNAQSEKLKTLRQSVQKPRDEIAALKETIRELERRMSKERNVEDRKVLKQERGRIRALASPKQMEVEQLTRQIQALEFARSAFLGTHASNVQKHAIERLRREFGKWQKGELDFEFKSPIHRVYWELLKPSGDSWREIVRHYEYLQRVQNERYELERLKQIHDLEPDVIYIGLASFEGYVVFVFKKLDCAVLECPRVGNALYVMDADNWKFLSQLSKTELLGHHRAEVRRIIHSWGWFHDLERELQRRSLA